MIELREPTFSDAIAFAGAKSFLRKVLLFQVRKTQARLVMADGEEVALVMFHTRRARVTEFAMVTKLAASAHMLPLTRLAHLTLSQMAEKGILVIAHVRESDTRAQRMARLVGFGPGRFLDRTIWTFRRRGDDGRTRHDHRQIGEEGRQATEGGPGAGRAAAESGADAPAL
jgi:hypothetical protein